MTTAGGQTLSYTYDALKRHTATTVTKNGSTIFRVAKSYYNHATDSTRTTAQVQYYNVRNSAGTLIAGSQYVYDKLGNIIQIKESESPYRVLVAYEYDALNQLTKETTYTYSGTSTTDNTTTVNRFEYDTAGNLLRVYDSATATEPVDEYTYLDNDWQDLLTKFNGTTINYDASGNPLNWYNGNTYTGLTWTQGRQLTTLSMETDTTAVDVTYAYDMSGMRSEKTVVYRTLDDEGGNEGGGIVVPGCNHEWVEINRTEYYIFYRCTKCSSTYQEPIQAPPTEYSLRSSTIISTEHHAYVYAGGQLMRETITTTDAEGNVTTEVLDFTYSIDITPVALTYTNGTDSPVTYYYVTNIQGDVVKLVSAGGTDVASYAYDAWGKVLSATGSMAEVNPIRYRGYYYDAETELYYLQSRYYDSEVRRFVNADIYPVTGQGLLGCNMYAYCGNNPAFRVDTGGEIWGTILDVISLVAGVVDVCKNPTDGWAWVGLVCDIVDVAVPILSGTGEAVRAIRTANKAGEALDAVSDAFATLKRAKEFGIKAYSELKKLVKGLGLEVHHIIEQRLVKHLGIDVKAMLSVVLTKAEHQIFTNAWRSFFKYGMDYAKLTINDLWEAAKQVYRDYPELLDAAYKILFGERSD